MEKKVDVRRKSNHPTKVQGQLLSLSAQSHPPIYGIHDALAAHQLGVSAPLCPIRQKQTFEVHGWVYGTLDMSTQKFHDNVGKGRRKCGVGVGSVLIFRLLNYKPHFQPVMTMCV